MGLKSRILNADSPPTLCLQDMIWHQGPEAKLSVSTWSECVSPQDSYVKIQCPLGGIMRWGLWDLHMSWTSPVAQLVKNPHAMQETWVWSLSWEDPLEKRKATHSSILAREFHGLYSSRGHKESDRTEWLSISLCHEGWSPDEGD